jgi:hypothetical protein
MPASVLPERLTTVLLTPCARLLACRGSVHRLTVVIDANSLTLKSHKNGGGRDVGKPGSAQRAAAMDPGGPGWAGSVNCRSAHLVAIASRSMRQILVQAAASAWRVNATADPNSPRHFWISLATFERNLANARIWSRREMSRAGAP